MTTLHVIKRERERNTIHLVNTLKTELDGVDLLGSSTYCGRPMRMTDIVLRQSEIINGRYCKVCEKSNLNRRRGDNG